MLARFLIVIVGVIVAIAIYWMSSGKEEIITVRESKILMDPFELSTIIMNKLLEYGVDQDIHSFDNVRVFDCSLGNGTNFVKESIPFSDFIDVEHTLINPFGTFPNAYPTPEIVKARMEVLGVNLNDTIVLYTQPNIPGAGRVYHILKNHGFSNVKILNGDLGYWKRRGLPVVPGTMRIYAKTILPELGFDSTSLAEVEQVYSCLVILKINSNYSLLIFQYAISIEKDPLVTLIDVREPNEYNGSVFSPNVVCRAGSICNSVNIPLSEILNPEGRFANNTEILNVLTKRNININTKFITYSNAGFLASDAYVIFKLILQHQVSVYDGSWREFGCVFKTQGCEVQRDQTLMVDATKEIFQSLNSLFH